MQIKLVAITLVLFAAVSQAVAEVPNTFVPGTPARASDVNENFLNLDGRITSLENATGGSTDFSGYDLPFSTIGGAKNVKILKWVDSEGDTFTFFALVRYVNNTEQVSYRGSLFTPGLISKSIMVSLDGNGNAIRVSVRAHSPETTDFDVYRREDKDYVLPSPGMSEVSSFRDDYAQIRRACSSGSIRLCIAQNSQKHPPETDERLFTTRTKLARTIADAFVLPSTGWSFEDVMLSSAMGDTSLSVAANGIGRIYTSYSDGSAQEAIYYRIDGIGERGSLAGTPFGPGGPLEGMFF